MRTGETRGLEYLALTAEFWIVASLSGNFLRKSWRGTVIYKKIAFVSFE